MPKITSIASQKNKRRVNIYLDGEFGFGLDLENFVKLGLKTEQELSNEKVREIIKKAEFQKNSDKLINFATIRPRSRRELNSWMVKHNVPESLKDDLYKKLERLELLGDERFAQWWVNQRMQFKSRSKRELTQELRMKGIDRKIIEKVLDESGVDDEASARKLIEKNKYKWEKYGQFEAKKKMTDYLARKGFSWDVINKVTKID